MATDRARSLPPPLASLLWLPAVLLVLLPAALRPTPAEAHANLVQSEPPAQAVLQHSPARVRLVYSEAVEPRFIEVTVLDAQRRRVDLGDAALAPGTDNAVTVSLDQALRPGVYTVQWRVVSAVDGHTTAGLVPFTVGDPGALPAAGAALPGAQSSASSGGLLGVVARWLVVLAAVTLTGSFAFVPLVLAPGLRRLEAMAAPDPDRRRRGPEDEQPSRQTVAKVGARASERLLEIARMMLGVFAVGAVLVLIAETAAARDSGPLAAVGRPMWDLLTQTRRGTLWLARAALIAVLGAGLVLVTRDVRRDARVAVNRRWTWGLLTAVGGATLLVQSLGSHAAALRGQETLAVLVDWVHLLAVALWVGGLVQLTFTLLPALAPLGGPPRTRLLAALVPRFSWIAGPSLAVIVLTGLYQTVRLSDGWRALVEEAWGRALALKLVLFAALALLGAFNLLIVSPRLRRLAGRLDRPARETAAAVRLHFRRAVMAEVGLAVLILFVVGVLIGTAPGQVQRFTPEGPFRPFLLDTSADGVDGRLAISPGRIGLNRFDLALTVPVADAAGTGAPVPADTQVVLRITTLDRDTGVTEVPMEALSGGRFTAAGTYLSTVGLWEVAAIVRRPGADEVRLPFQLSLTEDTGQLQVRSNLPAAPLERGRELYQTHCVSCHGVGARGDGPLAPALNPRPVDLTVHVPQHTDRALYDWIANGIPRTAMPAWKGQFSDEEIQAIINYLRQLADEANQQR
jgi:copper transport protein